MATKTLTMHRLLSEIKVMDKRIDSAITNAQFVTSCKNSDTAIGGKTLDKVADSIKASYQSITHLIHNKQVMEAARVKSNAETIVEIAGQSYTVADAIKRKSSISLEKRLLSEMVKQARTEIAYVNSTNEKVHDQCERHIRELYSGKTDDPDMVEKINATTQSYMDMNAVKMIDPLNIRDMCDTINKNILDFEAEVDAVLSESNAVTTVTIELED